MEICERKGKELEKLKNYYTQKYEEIKRMQRMLLYSIEKNKKRG